MTTSWMNNQMNTMSHGASASSADAACGCARTAAMQSASCSANNAIILIMDAIIMASIIICGIIICAIISILNIRLLVLVLLAALLIMKPLYTPGTRTRT